MAVNEQEIKDRYAIYNGDCIEGMRSLPSEKIHLSIYSPPFGGLFSYSSSERKNIAEVIANGWGKEMDELPFGDPVEEQGAVTESW